MNLSDAGSIGSILGGIGAILALSGGACYFYKIKNKNVKNSNNFNKIKIKNKGGNFEINIGDKKEK